jgi:hypothetical protein
MMHLLSLNFRFQLSPAKSGMSTAFRVKLESPLQVPEAQSTFIRAHNKALSVAAMRVCNPDRSPVRINR